MAVRSELLGRFASLANVGFGDPTAHAAINRTRGSNVFIQDRKNSLNQQFGQLKMARAAGKISRDDFLMKKNALIAQAELKTRR